MTSLYSDLVVIPVLPDDKLSMLRMKMNLAGGILQLKYIISRKTASEIFC